MNAEALERQFAKIGAHVRVGASTNRWRKPTTLFVDVRQGKEGEYFDITLGDELLDISVLNVDPKDRHLVLMSKREVGNNRFELQKFLCGHDERHWFVAGIPEKANVTTVKQAKEALRPESVDVSSIPVKERNKRKNAAFKRQGEWFFVPVNRTFPNNLILRNEPLLRAGLRASKPHHPEELVRTGGEIVYVHSKLAPTGWSEEEYRKFMLKPDRSIVGAGRWNKMVKNAEVFVRGKVRHSDHATLILDGWHKVYMNREGESLAMQSVVFLD